MLAAPLGLDRLATTAAVHSVALYAGKETNRCH